MRQKDRREARREGAKTRRGREAQQCQGVVGGEKEGMWIAPAAARGELQGQLAKVAFCNPVQGPSGGLGSKGWLCLSFALDPLVFRTGDEGAWGLRILPLSSMGKRRS